MKVSVIMSTYNRCDMVCGAVESFLNQDYKDADLIILDNGSTDYTPMYLSHYYPYKQIKVRTAITNITPPDNFNELLKHTTGDLICHLHDDDRLTKDSLSKRVAAFRADPSLQVLYAGWITGDKTYLATPPDKGRILRDEYINFLTMMWRKEVDATLDTDFKHYYDWLFKIRCFQKYKVGYIPDPVIHYTIHSGQESVKCRQQGLNEQEEKLMRSKI